MDMVLAKYSKINETRYLDYIGEWQKTNEKIVPYASRMDGRTFSTLQEKWAVDETDKAYETGFVPSTLYFMIDENEYIYGAIHYRHELTDWLYRNAGHIGYGIRPTQRGNGYATKMLDMLITMLKNQNIVDRVMLVCDDDNIGSARTIEKCNGALMDKIEPEDGLERRYWIDI